MTKRKRDDESDDNQSSKPNARKLRIQKLRLEEKLDHGVTRIHRALKVARGFERQKLGRRQKTARESRDTALSGRLNNEVEALKALDLGVTAQRHLVKQMTKTKRIAESPAFIELNTAERFPVPDAKRSDAEVNVSARLFKSNPIRDVMPGVLGDIRELLGIPDSVKQSKTKAHSAKPVRSDPAKTAGHEESIPKKKIPLASKDAISEDDEDIDMAQYEARIASSESDEDEEDVPVRNAKTANTSKYNPIDDLSASPTPSIASSDLAPAKGAKSKQKSSAATTFLPTLMGGYWSGSESEAEDDGEAAAPPRKNRMGQQARRQLWEKKFGSQAKHIQKQENASRTRDTGWDMRRGATSKEDTRGGYGNSRGPPARRWEQGGNSGQGGSGSTFGSSGIHTKPAVDQGPIHPSWEAAKKKKQQTAATFQGKKVTFD